MKNKLGPWLLYFAVLMLCLARPAFGASSYQVTIDTQAVSGKPGKLAFDFVSGDPTANTVTILNFSTDGTLGLPETQGGLVSGDIILRLNPAPVTTIEDGFFFNQLVQPFEAFGNQVTFTLQLTESHGATKIPDELTVLLLHKIDNPAKPMIGTADPLLAHALLAIDITGASGGLLKAFSPTQFTAPSTLTVVVPSLADMVAAVLPSSRSVRVGTAATAFVTMINASPSITVLDAGPSLSSLPASFTFQTTDPATNTPIGTANTLVNIPPGGTQSFVVALTPTAPFTSDVAFNFSAINASLVSAISGVNTLFMAASADPVPDIVALASTLPPDPGIVNIPGTMGTGVFAVATVNVGIGGLITVSADTGAATLPITLLVCQTNPQTGACLASPAPSVTTQIDANATPTFSIFAMGAGSVPFNPATNRVVARFKDAGGVTRGATSIAVRTQ